MRMNLPNQITTARFIMAIVFLVLLDRFNIKQQDEQVWIMDIAFVLFVVAALSDILDGHLARKYNQITAFGRILDPFVDKVLVVGAYILFLGSNFRQADQSAATGLEAWMVVVIVARELLVTGLRGFSEAGGKAFGANWWGKIKMLLQSITVGWVLTSLGRLRGIEWVLTGRTIVIWLMVGFTAISVIAYLLASRKALAEQAA